MKLLIEIQLFLFQYSWELLVTLVSITCVCSVFALWMDWRNEQISKNWKEYVNANN